MIRSTLCVFYALLVLLSLSRAFAATTDAGSIIQQVEDNLNGKSAILHLAMIVETGRSTRTMKMESYSIGSEKSFIKITYPGKDKGITFLKIENNMWQYVPRIEKIIKIPASMMLQSWMGSDFTNDDLVKESSISDDYSATLIDEDQEEYRINLKPLDNAPVVWGKIIMHVSKKHFLPTTVHYFDEDEVLVRTLQYSDVKQFNDRFYPTVWVMTPLDPDKKGHLTTVKIDYGEFNIPVSTKYFTKQALKRYSR